MAPADTPGEAGPAETSNEPATLPPARFDKLLAFWNALPAEIQGSLLSLPVETQTQLAGLVQSRGDNTAAFWNLLPGEVQTQFASLPHVLKAHLSHELGGPWLNHDDPGDNMLFGAWLHELFQAGELGVDFFKTDAGEVGNGHPRHRHQKGSASTAAVV